MKFPIWGNIENEKSKLETGFIHSVIKLFVDLLFYLFCSTTMLVLLFVLCGSEFCVQNTSTNLVRWIEFHSGWFCILKCILWFEQFSHWAIWVSSPPLRKIQLHWETWNAKKKPQWEHPWIQYTQYSTFKDCVSILFDILWLRWSGSSWMPDMI